jgi:alkylation response protein AidB-like acyl-CoA dehydrogenase
VDLRPSEEQQQLRDALRRLFERRMAELVERLPDPPRHDAARDLADALAVGLPGLGLPEDVGGVGTLADLAVAHEELGRGLAGPLLPAIGAAGRLLLHASGTGRHELLAAVADGTRTATVALDMTSVVAGPAVTDVLIVNGNDVFVVPSAVAQWREHETGCDIPTWAITVEASSAAEGSLAIEASGIAAFHADVAVLAAARQLGGGRAVLERTIDHVRTREQFDRAIGTFQAVQHQLADIATELDATELTVAQGAWAIDAGLAPDEVRRLAAIAALTATAAFRRATLVAHQLHGGMGFVLDSPLHLWSARAVADPTVPMTRADLLDEIADSSGITAEGIAVPPDHRVSL